MVNIKYPEYYTNTVEYTKIIKEQQMNYTEKITSQAIGEHAVKNQRFIIGSISQKGEFSFSVNPALHTDIYTARAECKRLAIANPGKTYVFVQLKGAERVVPQPTTLSI